MLYVRMALLSNYHISLFNIHVIVKSVCDIIH